LIDPIAPRPAVPAWAEVDLDRLEANARRVVAEARRDVLAVVKSSAYGHGAVPTARAFAAGGVKRFGVFLVDEALELRDGGLGEPILVMGPFLPERIGEAIAAGATLAAYSAEALDALDAEGARRGTRLPFHLKLDTGMSRLGVPAAEVGAFLERLASRDHVELDGIFTHLACADDPESPMTGEQIASFGVALEAVRAAGYAPRIVHLPNSAAVLRDLDVACDAVRPGLALYGYSPQPDAIPVEGIAPALAFRTYVAQVKRVPVGTTVGYGATWTAARPSVIASLPVGYEEGYRRELGNRAEVLIGGRRAPVVGRVSMDLTTVDVTDLPEVSVGDVATLLGESGSDRVDAWELARHADTVAWDILCGISARIPRLLHRSGTPAGVESLRRDATPGGA